MEDQLLIIGAGPAGLALSHRFGAGARILEASSEVGGLARSVEFGGGVFDIGGHSFHTPHPEVASLVERLMAGRWHVQRRDARVFVDGRLIDYPFQQHFAQIGDPAIVAECRASLPPAGAQVEAANYEDWIVRRFGAGIARHFMLPYNRKLWARDLSRMSADWVGERVAQSGSARAGLRQPLEADASVGYPADGGFGGIFQALAARAGPIEFDQTVIEIDPAANTVRTAAGDTWPWRRLASTMPLPDLMRCIRDCPSELIAAADRLEYVSLKILMILVAKPIADQPQRVYVADPAVPPHKIAFNHASSPSLRARPVHAITCEIAYSPERSLASEAELQSATTAWLVRAGLIDVAGDVEAVRFVDVPYGYPVPTPDRAPIVERLRAWLEGHGIHSIGRFGGWAYANSDACIREGLQLADQFRVAA